MRVLLEGVIMTYPVFMLTMWQIWSQVWTPPKAPELPKKKRFEDGGPCKGKRVQL